MVGVDNCGADSGNDGREAIYLGINGINSCTDAIYCELSVINCCTDAINCESNGINWGVFTELCLHIFLGSRNYTCLLGWGC